MEFPELDSHRLALTRITPADSHSLFLLFSNPAVIEYYNLAPLTQLSQAESLIARLEERFRAGESVRWAIRLKSDDDRYDGELMGTCGFNSWEPTHQSAVIGYDLHPDYWGQGYAKEAVSRTLESGFAGDLSCGPLHRVQADTVPGNLASEALLRKLGFEEEGLRRQAGYWKNRFHDLKCFGLLQPDFLDKVSKPAVIEQT